MEARLTTDLSQLCSRSDGAPLLLIDPTNMTPEHSYILNYFLAFKVAQRELVFYAEREYPFPAIPTESAIYHSLQHLGLDKEQLHRAPPLYISLTDKLVWRKCNNDTEDHRYDLYSDEQLGVGHYGAIQVIPGTLVPQADLSLRFKEYRHPQSRVAKIQWHADQALVKNEYAMLIHFPELGVKRPTIADTKFKSLATYLLMNKIPGESLDTFLNRDREALENGENHLSVALRLRIAQAFLLELQRVHHVGIVHRDIKPGNMMLSMLNDIIKIKIIDYGLSTYAANNDHEHEVGTPYYMAPEAFTARQDITKKSDIFSAACVLALLFRADENHATSIHHLKRTSQQAHFDQLLNGIDDVPAQTKKDLLNKIEKLLTKMVIANPAQRPTIDNVLRGFLPIMQKYSLSSDADRLLPRLKDAMHIGAKLRNKLLLFPISKLAHYTRYFEQLRKLFREALAQLKDHPAVMKEFVFFSHIGLLQDATTKAVIAERLEFTLQQFQQHYARLNNLATVLEKSGCDTPLDPQAQAIIKKMQRTIAHLLSKDYLPVNLDNIAYLAHQYKNYLCKCATLLESIKALEILSMLKAEPGSPEVQKINTTSRPAWLAFFSPSVVNLKPLQGNPKIIKTDTDMSRMDAKK